MAGDTAAGLIVLALRLLRLSASQSIAFTQDTVTASVTNFSLKLARQCTAPVFLAGVLSGLLPLLGLQS